MKSFSEVLVLCWLLGGGLSFTATPLWGGDTQALEVGSSRATIALKSDGDLRTYELSTTMLLRDNKPPDKRVTFSEDSSHATIRTGSLLFDGLYAMAVSEALANSVSEISDSSYANGAPVRIEAFQTGEFWKYVWTRDLSYSVYLALAGLDPQRSVNSLLFKTSVLKSSVSGGRTHQIIQDTGSGGSYPVSSDRVVWALGASETLKYLPAAARQDFLEKAYPILCDSIEQDRRLTFDPGDGLYRGEQSFLDWREQTYPGWVKDNVLAIAMSKALSVNVANYFLLKTTADYSRLLGHAEQESRYTGWANVLKDSINSHFFDPKAGLYSTYLLSEDGSPGIRVARYDLLSQSLAILVGVADERRAESIIGHYPVGPFGPPVVWPQEKSVPIYHNQAIWPFVTAYWIKAAQKAGNAAAVDAGIQSLEQLAALNLSNMENFDFVSGRSQVDDGSRRGPVINSRRQLWSVAGYLSMVQDVVFGLKTSWDGIGFQPFITARLRNETFRSTDTLELRNLTYLGTRNDVLVHLPPAGSFSEGSCVVDRLLVNGRPVFGDIVKADALQPVNKWEVFLQAPVQAKAVAQIRKVDVSKEQEIFAPAQPEWEEQGQGGLTLAGGRVVLNYRQENAANVAFNIYRDGELCAENVRQTKWTDPLSGDYRDRVHSYAVAAVDVPSGNISHLTPSRSYRSDDQVIPAADMQHHGGDLVAGQHFENWGKPGDELVTKSVSPKRGGRYSVQAAFSNGSGPINTGITCAVKKLEVRNADSGEVVASGYLVMPQSGDWKRWGISNSIDADLEASVPYTVRLSEDEYSRNMSYLKNNERYTAGPGGGDQSYNYVNIASVNLLYSGPSKREYAATNPSTP
jgi:hypothetical protein